LTLPRARLQGKTRGIRHSEATRLVRERYASLELASKLAVPDCFAFLAAQIYGRAECWRSSIDFEDAS